MADKTNLDSQKLNTALEEFTVVGLHHRINTINKTLTKKRILMQVGMYFIAPIHLLHFLMMGRYRQC
jgi:hypothetical protein